VIILAGKEAYHQFTGGYDDILDVRGYPIWDSMRGAWLMPTVHPDYLRQGNSNFGAVIIHDFQRAIALRGVPYTPVHKTYSLDPSPEEALAWARVYVKVHSHRYRLAFDIETPWKDDDEGDSDTDTDFHKVTIDRISFAYAPNHALSIPWHADYRPVIDTLLSGSFDKVVWNRGFDVPAVRANGIKVNGIIHDGMVMWHVLQSDLPKKLGFAATFLVPSQERWKHLSQAQPAYYNAVDSDVEAQAVVECERQLRANGMWNVYLEQVMMPDVPLTYMSGEGMPVDPEKRWESAEKLDDLLAVNFEKVQEVVPHVLRKVKVSPKIRNIPEGGLAMSVVQLKKVKMCKSCNAMPVTKTSHPKKKCFKNHPDLVETEMVVTVKAVLLPFNCASPKQLLEYMKHKGHKVIMKRNKPTTDEKALKLLQGKYPEDKLYPLVLERRKLDKLAGTYVGRLEEVTD
jgi:hypothetical protein